MTQTSNTKKTILKPLLTLVLSASAIYFSFIGSLYLIEKKESKKDLVDTSSLDSPINYFLNTQQIFFYYFRKVK